MRGSLFDVFPMGSQAPLRIDLFDDEIEAIRRFDPETQRSLDSLEKRAPAARARGAARCRMPCKDFSRRFRTRFEGDPTRIEHLSRRERGTRAARASSSTCRCSSMRPRRCFDYLPPNAVIVHDAALPGALAKAWHDIEARYEDRRHDIERPVLPPGGAVPRAARSSTRSSSASPPSRWRLQGRHGAAGAATRGRRNFPTAGAARAANRRAGRAARSHRWTRFLAEFAGRVLIAADSPGQTRSAAGDAARPRPHRRDRARLGCASPNGKARARPDRGARPAGPHTHRTAASPSFPKRSCSARARRQERRRKRAAADPEAILRDLQDLNPGAPVVHEEYGVGRYVGLQPMEVGGPAGRVPGAGVPGRRPRVCARPLAASGHPLHRRARPRARRCTSSAPTNGPRRAQARRRADPRRRRGAARPVRAPQGAAGPEAAAQRARVPDLRRRLPVRGDRGSGRSHPRRCSRDLASDRPMDRIVCGDVGFGKTEVAMRAAFVAVAGRQAGGRAGAHDAARPTAPHQLPRPLRRLAGRDRGALAVRQRQGNAGDPRGHRERHGRHRHRDASAAARARALQGSGADHRRRGASLRRARQGAAAGAARRMCTF